jgi:CAP12/Pycsar effector protein, TIR domain
MPRATSEATPEDGATVKPPPSQGRTKDSKEQQPANKRSYLKQTDAPITSLDDALRLPQAIFDHYAGKPTAPFNVAKALNVDPKGSQLKVLSGGAIAFGLIEGGAQASAITVTDLARRVIRPKAEDEDTSAKREAVLRPRIFGEFLRTYDGNQFPRRDIALNVLEDLGVPRDKTEEVFERISESARSVGFIEELKGKYYVRLDPGAADPEAASPPSGTSASLTSAEQPNGSDDRDLVSVPATSRVFVPPRSTQVRGAAMVAALADDQRRRRVFITHGKNRAFVDPIKKLLDYGELEPVVSVERQSVSKPVPEHVILNPNVLIEIGAAMAFYGRRFILLVREGVKLPSNLQGLYEVRYTSEVLDAVATIKLLEAMKDIKNYSLPTDQESE